MKLSTLLSLALYLSSPLALADIYKCKDAKGNDKYQNFPCPIDSIGSRATAPAPKAEAAKPAREPPRMPNYVLPNPGMKMNDVRGNLGPPKATNIDKGIETWFYQGPDGISRGVRFDRTGTVLSVVEAEPPPQED